MGREERVSDAAPCFCVRAAEGLRYSHLKRKLPQVAAEWQALSLQVTPRSGLTWLCRYVIMENTANPCGCACGAGMPRYAPATSRVTAVGRCLRGITGLRSALLSPASKCADPKARANQVRHNL